MAVLQGGGQNLPSHVCVIQKTPCGIGLMTRENKKSRKHPLIKDRPDINSLTDNCKISQTVIFIHKTCSKRQTYVCLSLI